MSETKHPTPNLTKHDEVKQLLDAFWTSRVHEYQDLAAQLRAASTGSSEPGDQGQQSRKIFENISEQMGVIACEALITEENKRLLIELIQEKQETGAKRTTQEWMDFIASMSHHPTFAGAKNTCTINDRRQFCKVSRDAYDSNPTDSMRPPESLQDPLWKDDFRAHCPVTDLWYNSCTNPRWEQTRATQLIPAVFERGDLEALCGVTEQNLTSYRNGLSTFTVITNGLERFQSVIMPSHTREPGALQLHVVDERYRWRPSWLKDSDTWQLEDAELQFVNENRPSLTCLYFRYVMCWLQAYKRRENGLTKHDPFESRRFEAITPMMERTVLASLATHIAGPDAWEEFQATHEDALYDDDDQDAVVKELRGARLAQKWRVFYAKATDEEAWDYDDGDEDECPHCYS